MNKNRLCAIGEALIDFIPEVKGQRLKDVPAFSRVAGGAPANVAGAVTKLGIPSKFLTKLGDDPFGDYIVEVLQDAGIDTSCIRRDEEGETALAFVSLAVDGNRDFKFYRKNSADLRYCADDIPADVLDDCGMIHFCSVDLVESPMKQAHRRLIEMAQEKGVLISFDPNLRFSLWEDIGDLKRTVREFLPCADIVKISDEELEFITGHTDIEQAALQLLADGCKCVVYTKGKDGAQAFTRNGMAQAAGYPVEVRDTTGAGDSFIGAFLFCLLRDQVEDPEQINMESLKKYLEFANAYAAYTTTKEGALAAMATKEQMAEWMNFLQRHM
ncbi:MAG: carbohydrate kinase [Brotaphodocola sp.]